MNNKLKILLVILCIALGIGLRSWKYAYYPYTGHAEEYLFVWSGLSLIETGFPISWNDIPVYKESNVYYRGIAPNHGSEEGSLGVRLIKPWLDEPPLFSLMVGGMAKLYNLPNFTVISPFVIRLPSLFFSLISLLFVYLIAKSYFGFNIAVLSLLVYGTVPTFVFGSRLAVPENLITSLFLVCFWLINSYLQSQKKWQRNLAIFLSGITGLAKPTGYLLVFLVAYFLFQKKKWKEGTASFLIGSLLFWVPFLGYGKYFDWKLFIDVFNFQSSRPAGWSSLAYILTNPGFSIEFFLDGFVILGIISVFVLIFKKDKNTAEINIAFGVIFTILMTIISGGKHDQLTWYRYPIYPFLSITTALMIRDIYVNCNFFYSALFIPLLLGNIDLMENPFWKFNYLIQSKPYRFVFFLLLLPSIISLIFKNKAAYKLSKMVFLFCFIFSIYINILVVKSTFNISCDHQHCPLPEKVNLLQILKFK